MFNKDIVLISSSGNRDRVCINIKDDMEGYTYKKFCWDFKDVITHNVDVFYRDSYIDWLSDYTTDKDIYEKVNKCIKNDGKGYYSFVVKDMDKMFENAQCKEDIVAYGVISNKIDYSYPCLAMNYDALAEIYDKKDIVMVIIPQGMKVITCVGTSDKSWKKYGLILLDRNVKIYKHGKIYVAIDTGKNMIDRNNFVWSSNFEFVRHDKTLSFKDECILRCLRKHNFEAYKSCFLDGKVDKKFYEKSAFSHDDYDEALQELLLTEFHANSYEGIRNYILGKSNNKFIKKVVDCLDEFLQKYAKCNHTFDGYRIIKKNVKVGDVFVDKCFVPLMCYKKKLENYVKDNEKIVKVIVQKGCKCASSSGSYSMFNTNGIVVLNRGLKYKCTDKNEFIVIE